MGCFGGKIVKGEEKKAKSNSQIIEEQIRKDKKQANKEVKMLLLGAGESGKSTILKQMKLIHDGGYQLQERKFYKSILCVNLFQAVSAVINAMEALEIPWDNKNNEEYMITVRDMPESLVCENISGSLAEAFRIIFSDSGFQECTKRGGRDYYLFDSAKYLMNSLDRIVDPEYMPTDQDILRSRVKTTGVTETLFQIGDINYRMFDVGGQRSERKKWINCFDGVTALIFMVAISEYDQKLIEDEKVNRMQEALTIFDSICNSQWFSKTSMILFMNKMDILEEKIDEVPIEKSFPDYKGGRDVKAACAYFEKRFTQLNRNDSKALYVHFTCATDTDQIRFVMGAVNDIIIKNSLRMAGLM